MNIQINKKLIIPNHEIQWRFSRSSGAGGQNVNKTETRVEIIFNINNSRALNALQKSMLRKHLKNNINKYCITITAQEKRTQLENRKLAIYKLKSLLKNQLKASSKTRKITKPTKVSQKRRVESKKKRGELKKSRQSKLEIDL
tara:strand:- start:176 stop:604 length:429 start_codon:yes stop_codon:yes gene_type:complete